MLTSAIGFDGGRLVASILMPYRSQRSLGALGFYLRADLGSYFPADIRCNLGSDLDFPFRSDLGSDLLLDFGFDFRTHLRRNFDDALVPGVLRRDLRLGLRSNFNNAL